MGPEHYNVDAFVSKFRDSFGASYFELALIIAIFGLIAYIYYKNHKRILEADHRYKVDRSARLFRRGVKQFAIAPAEKALLKELAEFLEHPDYQAHWLFEKEDIYKSCARKLKEKKPGYDYQVMMLKVKLAFKEKINGKIIRSTTDLPVDTRLAAPGAQGQLRVKEVTPAYLVTEKIKPVQAGIRQLDLVFKRSEGFYQFTGRVIRQEGDLLFLRHTEITFRQQQREHFRYDEALPVELEGNTGLTINLGGGGALLELEEDGMVIENESYNLQLFFSETRYLQCVARVIEKNGNTTRVQFTQIRDADRDLILGHLMKKSQKDLQQKTG